MSRFVRASKVRHVYCQPAKPEEQYSNFRLSTATGDHNYIKANTEFFAIPIATGGGSLAVHKLSEMGRLPAQPPVLDGHRGPVLDFEFNPMHENIIATAGDDCTVKVWGIPEGGMTESISEPLVDMVKHQRKIVVLRFHPTAEHVLASGGADHSLKLWDVQKSECKVEIDHGELIQDVVWNYDGSKMASSAKDKLMRIIDPRSGEIAGSVEAHNGPKTSKLTFLGPSDKLCSVGFTRQSKRQFKIWDMKKLSAPVCTMDLDQAAGVIMPFYDEGSQMLFLGGKGDGNIRYFETVDEDPWAFSISDYKASSPCRGLCIMPTRVVDTGKCELVRMLKLTGSTVEPLSFICPRKSDLFQADLYPDTYAGKPAMGADDFFGGRNKKPVMMSMDPEVRAAADAKASAGGGGQVAAAKKAFTVQKTPAQLQDEVDKLKKYIDTLTALLEKNKIKVPEP